MDRVRHESLAEISLSVLAIASGSCLISLMVQFLGGDYRGSDLQGLFYLQALITPAALIACLSFLHQFVDTYGWSAAPAAIWRAIPQWLVFAYFMLNSLVLFGVIAYVIVATAAEVDVTWHEWVPLACMLTCSTAFMMIKARMNTYPGSPPALSGRWTS